MNDRHLSPQIHLPRPSQIPLSATGRVQALVDAIDQTAREGGVDPVRFAQVYVLHNLNLCNPHHWAAYAKIACVDPPDQTTIDAVKTVYANRRP
jgi:hypothetical protein